MRQNLTKACVLFLHFVTMKFEYCEVHTFYFPFLIIYLFFNIRYMVELCLPACRHCGVEGSITNSLISSRAWITVTFSPCGPLVFLLALRFPHTSWKHAGRWILHSIILPGGNMCMHGALQWIRLWIHQDPVPGLDKALTEDVWTHVASK